MEISNPEQARTAIEEAVSRAIERLVSASTQGHDPVRFVDVLSKGLPDMVSRVLRSVEESFWRREIDRRQRDVRFDYGDAQLRELLERWDAQVRATMLLTAKELRQLVGRALTLQMDAIVSPVETIKTNYFARQDKLTVKNAIIIANHLGLEERYVRALAAMAADDDGRLLGVDDFQRLLRDVDAKEHYGSSDSVAMAALSQATEVLGLGDEDESISAPAALIEAFAVLMGTPGGLATVRQIVGSERSVPVSDLVQAFAPDSGPAPAEPAHGGAEVARFLEDIGLDPDAAEVEVAASGGTIRFVLTEEEKQAYVARAVGRNVHLVEPIMKAIEGALTWDEVDRAITEMTPDSVRDEDSTAGSFRSRIG
jgi:hypothetical protein